MLRPTFLGLEALIVERLQAANLPAGARVLSVEDLSEAREASLPKPSVRVVYGGHRIIADGSPLPPGWAMVEQTWLAVVAVRNVRDIKAGAAARGEASPLCDAVLDTLDGWSPGGGYGTLKSATPGLGPLTVEGCSYVPFAFVSRFRRSKECS